MLAWLLAAQAAWGQALVGAQVMPSPHAVPGAVPVIDAAPNGAAVVHIAAPNAMGISRNQYEQFNVAPAGMVLNNSATQVGTALGGLIGANPQLGTRPASIILNEVISAAPSHLHGAIEVAGARADVVVANPNGIQCDGCGFLNAARATLTTGVPRMDANGSLQGFDIETGRLSVGAGGLDARGLQQLELLARGITVMGPIQAEQLRILAGANRVDYDGKSPASTLQGGAQPLQFAVDISELGGMYAKQIYLLATEQGVGVNSRGRLAAMEGNLQLSSAGDLHVHDAFGEQGVSLESAAGKVLVTGAVASPGEVSVLAAEGVRNRGTLQAGERMVLRAPEVSQEAAALVSTHRDLIIEGSLRNTGAKVHVGGNLVVTGSLFNENADLRTEAVTSVKEVNEVRYADERTPEVSYSADQVRFDSHGNLILPSETYPHDRYGSEAYGSFWDKTIIVSDRGISAQAIYADTDPVWERFGVASGGASGDHGAQATPSERRHINAQNELKSKLDAFNADLEKRTKANYFTTTVNQLRTTEHKVLASQPGLVFAHGAISVGGGANKDSFIVADGEFTSSGGFANHSSPAQRTVVALGHIQRSWREEALVAVGARRRDDPLPMASIVSSESFAVDARPSAGVAATASPTQTSPAWAPELIWPGGSRLEASDIRIQAPGERFTNSGVLHAHGAQKAGSDAGGTVEIQAGSIALSGSLASRETVLRAEQDIVAVGARLDAPPGLQSSFLRLQAGRNIDLLPVQAELEHIEEGVHAKAHLTERTTSLKAGHIHLQAGQDVVARGSEARAANALWVTAERHVDIGPSYEQRSLETRPVSANPQRQQAVAGAMKPHWRQEFATPNGALWQGGETLVQARKNMTLAGSHVSSEAGLRIEGQNICIESAATDQRNDVRTSADAYSLHTESQRTSAGPSTLTAGQDAAVVATANIEVMGSHIKAESGQASLIAGGDVVLGGGVALHVNEATRAEQLDSWVSWYGNESKNRTASAKVQGSQIEGRRVAVEAGRDVAIMASTVAGDQAVAVDADRHITFAGERASLSEHHHASEKKRGLFLSGSWPMLGWSDQATSADSDVNITERSAVGSLEGDVHMQAGGSYKQVGSDLLAAGDININARNIDLSASADSDRQFHNQSQSQTAMSLGWGFAGFVGQGWTGVQHVRTAFHAPSARTMALRSIVGMRSLRAAHRMLAPGVDEQGNVTPAPFRQWDGLTGGVRVDAGWSKFSTEELNEKALMQTASVQGGGVVRLQADAQSGTLRSEGAQVEGARIELSASSIDLSAAKMQSKHEAGDSGSGLGVGGVFGATTGLDAMANLFSGAAKRQDTQYAPTRMRASDSARMEASQGVALRGAMVEADSVYVRVGHDLSLESVPEQVSAAANSSSVDLMVGESGGVRFAGVSRMQADGASELIAAQEQSGFAAGLGGFDITVGGTTRLVGAVIGSEAPASVNRLTSARLEAADLMEVSEYHGSTMAGYLGYSHTDAGNLGAGASLLPSVPQADRDSVRREARSAIAPAAIVLTQDEQGARMAREGAVHRETSRLGLDQPKDVRETLREQAAWNMAARFANPASLRTDWSAFAQPFYEQALREGDARAASFWGPGGLFRAAGHIGIDALVGPTGRD